MTKTLGLNIIIDLYVFLSLREHPFSLFRWFYVFERTFAFLRVKLLYERQIVHINRIVITQYLVVTPLYIARRCKMRTQKVILQN